MKPNECVDRLEDLLGEFPYESPADRANAVGMLVGQVLKPVWVSPILIVDKPASQTGATMLCQTIAALADGLPIATLTQGRTADETDKRVITKLANMPPSILIDNISVSFTSDIIASGLTSPYTGARKLGGHAEALVSTLALQWYVSGVNALMSKDMVNRALSVRLNAKMEHPEERTGFRHKLPQDAFAHREYYFSAALSMVQNWVDAGCPSGTTTVLDTFGDWMLAVAGILETAGIEGFNTNRNDFLERTDVHGAEAKEFVGEWYRQFRTDPKQPADLLGIAKRIFTLGGKDQAGEAQSLGHRIRALLDRVFRVDDVDVAVRRTRQHVSQYYLERQQGCSQGFDQVE